MSLLLRSALATCALALIGCGPSEVEIGGEPEDLSAVEERALDATTTIQGEAMSLPSSAGRPVDDPSASGGKALLIWSNATASAWITLPASTRVAIKVRGHSCSGAPQLVAKLDGVTRLNVPVPSSTWTTFGFDASIAPGTHSLQVAFTNDYLSSSCDRNLFVDKLVITAAPTQQPIALGAFIADFGGSAPWNPSVIDSYTNMVGRKPAIIMWYQDWRTSSFPSTAMDTVVNRGLSPMLTWEPWLAGGGAYQPAYRLSAIAAGQHDALIRAFARGAKSWGKPFYLRFAHEMNGDWYPWGTKSGNPNGNSAAEYVAAWKRVRSIFDSEAVTNARWVWCPNVLMSNSPSYAALYPGDASVDWLGLDGYNFGGTGWKSLATVFGPSHDAIAALSSRPLAIVETASTEVGGNKASWITQGLGTEVPTRLPRVRAVVWFHTNKEADWRVNSSASSLTAFKAQATSTRYSGAIP